MSRYRRRFRTALFLWLMRRHKQPYRITHRGVTLWVDPEVLSPRYDWCGRFGIECLPDVRGRSMLEIGCGCGLVSVFAARGGASRVIAADISPAAVQNARKNFVLHGLDPEDVVESDLFAGVLGPFDLIFFAAPFHGEERPGLLERALCDENYATLLRFIAEAPAHLSPDGRILLGFSNSGDVALVETAFSKANLQVLERREAVRQGYHCVYFTLGAAAI